MEGDVTPEAPVEVAPDQPAEVTTDTTPSFTDVDISEEPEGGATPEWLQERYKQMHGDYTRKTQELASTRQERQEEADFLEALRSDRDTQLAVLEQLQELLSESDDDGELEDGEEPNPLEQRLSQLEQERATERAAVLAKEITGHIEQLAKAAGVELDEHDLQSVFDGATGGDIGKQQTEDAFKAFHAREKARYDKWQKGYLASKQTGAQVPAGTSATDAPDLNDRNTRLSRFAAILTGD